VTVDAIMTTDVAHADRTLAQPTFNNCYRQNDLFYLSHLHTGTVYNWGKCKATKLSQKRHHFWRWHFYIVKNDCIVGVVTKATWWTIWVRIPAGTKELSLHHNVQSHSVVHPSSYSVSIGDSSHHLMPRLSINGTTCPVPLYGVQRDNFYYLSQ